MRQWYLSCKYGHTTQCPNLDKPSMQNMLAPIKNAGKPVNNLRGIELVNKLCSVCTSFTPFKKHGDCKFYGFVACKYSSDETMKRATQLFQKTDGGYPRVLDFPDFKEIDVICSNCIKFTSK